VRKNPSHKVYERRWREHARQLDAAARLFIAVQTCCLVYCDRSREEHGDYMELARLPYSTLELRVRADCPPDLRRLILADATRMQARRGELFPIAGNMNVRLGGKDGTS
jgi:hypothetical protein